MSNYADRSNSTLMADAVNSVKSLDYSTAIDICLAIVEREPSHSAANALLFNSYFKTEQFEKARQIGGLTAQLNPTSEYVLHNQACLQLDAKQPAAAAGLLKSLIDQHGERPDWLYNLGLAQRMAGRLDTSIDLFEKTIAIDPEHDRAVFQLAELCQRSGRMESAIRSLNFLRLLRPRHAPSHSHYIHQAAISGASNAEDLEREVRLWADRFIPKKKKYPKAEVANPKSIVLGFNIGEIPRAWWLNIVVPVLNQLSENDQIFVYWNDLQDSPQVLASNIKVVNTHKMLDAAYARMVREDNIEIMVDVCGFRPGNRQRVLGLRVAPKQYGWLAHEGMYASGRVNLIEHSIGSKRFYFNDLNESPANYPLSQTIFGLNASQGICRLTAKTWSTILHKLDGWVLELGSPPRDIQHRLVKQFRELGIDKSKIIFDSGLLPSKRTLALENISSNDPLQSFAAMRRGATLLAYRGSLMPAQQTCALLHQLEQHDWIIKTVDEYIDAAVDYCSEGNFGRVIDSQFKKSGVNNLSRFTQRFRRVLLES